MSLKAGQLISRGQRAWLVRVSLGRDPESGTRRYHNKTIHGSMREAQIYLNARLQERDIGKLPRAAAIQLDPFLDQWLVTAARPRLRAKSYADYEALLRLHIRPVLGPAIGSITSFDRQTLCAKMFQRGLSARSIEAEDPCETADLPRKKGREMDALSVDESRRFLAPARESEWFALFALALTTGMRPSEYLGLKWSDIDWQRGAASVSRSLTYGSDGSNFDDPKRKRRSSCGEAPGFCHECPRTGSRRATH